MSEDTLLVLTGIGIPDYSERGLTQTLEPVEAAISLRRMVNGGPKDLSFAQFRKYKSTISGRHQERQQWMASGAVAWSWSIAMRS